MAVTSKLCVLDPKTTIIKTADHRLNSKPWTLARLYLLRQVFKDDCRFVDPTNDVSSLSRYKKALCILFDPAESKVVEFPHKIDRVDCVPDTFAVDSTCFREIFDGKFDADVEGKQQVNPRKNMIKNMINQSLVTPLSLAG